MENKYGFLIEVASRQIKQAFQRRLQEAGVDLTVDQWVVLDQLLAGPRSQIQVVEAVYKDPPTVTRIVDVLVRKGLVLRKTDPIDRRRFNVELTAPALVLMETLKPVVGDFRSRGWEGLTAEDYRHLHRIMTKIVGNFDLGSAASLTDTTSIAQEKAA